MSKKFLNNKKNLWKTFKNMQNFMNFMHLSIHTYVCRWEATLQGGVEKIINRHVHTSEHIFKRILKYVYVWVQLCLLLDGHTY